MDPTSPDPNSNCCPNGLSSVIEGRPGNNAGSNRHNGLHVTMGGVMGYFISPAAAIEEHQRGDV